MNLKFVKVSSVLQPSLLDAASTRYILFRSQIYFQLSEDLKLVKDKLEPACLPRWAWHIAVYWQK